MANDPTAAMCGFACIGVFALIILIIIALAIYEFFFKKGKLRAGAATPLNAELQYKEFLSALDSLAKRYSLDWVNKPASVAALVPQMVGKKGLVLLSGRAAGRQFSVSAVLGGDSLLTELALMHIPGLGREMRFIAAGAPVLKTGRIQILPESAQEADRTKRALSPPFVAKLEELILLKPKVMNLSSQLVEFYEKKFAAFREKAVLRDYGLIRDREYALELAKRFLEAASEWENKR
jgi:hypothetical protein